MRRFASWSIATLVFLLGGPLCGHAASTPAALPGLRSDGSVLLPNQWSLKPAGRQLDLGDFPVSIAVHPSGAYAAILHSGYGKQQVTVVDLNHFSVVAKAPIEESFYGIEFSPDGRNLYCSGAGS